MNPLTVDWLPLTPAVTAGAYSAQDVVGGLLEFPLVYPIPGHGALLEAITVIDEAGVMGAAAFHFVIFEREPAAAIADNAALSTLTDADALLIQAVIQVAAGDFRLLGLTSQDVATKHGLTIPVQGRSKDTSLFAYLVTEGTPTFAAVDDVTIKLGVIRS